MPLDVETRGMLEKMIDNAIAGIPLLVKMYRAPKVKAHFMLKEETDFVFGICVGLAYYPVYIILPSDSQEGTFRGRR